MSRRVGITSNTVPWEILRAAGYSPRLLEFEPGPTPHADRFMEDVFDRRIRVIFDRLCAGAWAHLDLVVIPRTSEQEHKLYLYLREASRAHFSDAIPKLYFYDLLHTRTSESYRYGLERTRHMVRDFEVSGEALRDAIVESNQARRAVRTILEKRSEGLLNGATAFELLRGFYTEDRAAFADRVPAQLEASCATVPTGRPRILIMGAPLDCADLHRVLEQAGGYVAAEDDWRGSRAAGDCDVSLETDPATAIFEKYFHDEVSPRIQSSSERGAWFQRAIASGQVDGVLFYIPFEDDVAGWDYPRQADWLEKKHVPNLVIRDTNAAAAVGTFIDGLSRN
ncbi:MAG: 2-hydroxyacyl-CoA dehydratase family protein [Acidobacteriota bacterium]